MTSEEMTNLFERLASNISTCLLLRWVCRFHMSGGSFTSSFKYYRLLQTKFIDLLMSKIRLG